MNDDTSSEPFGSIASKLLFWEALLALEQKESRAELFTEVDEFSAHVIVRALKQEAMVTVERGRRDDHLTPSVVSIRLSTPLSHASSQWSTFIRREHGSCQNGPLCGRVL